MPGCGPGFCMGGENLNEHLLKRNEEIYRKLNIPAWHAASITGAGVNVAVIGYGGCLASKKPYLTNVNDCGNGSYHDGDEIIHAVAPGAKIFGINIFKGGWSFDEALRWCLEHDIDVICTSIRLSTWGYEREELSRQLYEKGCIMIDSADNEGKEDSIGYPAKSPYWFAVGAYDELNKGKAGYSSWGKGLDCLMYTDLAVEAKEGYYVPISHTSGATQLVAGMAALLKEHLRITPEGFREFIRQHSIDIGEEGWDPKTGFGLFVLPKEIPKKEGTTVKVCIDPGHGQHDPGAVGPGGTKEKDVALSVALKVGEWLKKHGIDVVFTRTNDNPGFPTDEKQNLAKRVSIANTAKADIFVSVHCNSAGNKQARGLETYCYALGGNGEKLARAIQEEVRKATGFIDRGVKTANFYVLRYTQMPAVLVELGFISNPDEEKILASTDFQAKAAEAIAKGICRYFGIQWKVEEVPKCKTDYAGHWAEAAIEKVKAAGLMSGYPDGKFKPDQPVTRAELAAVLARILDKWGVKA